MLSMLSATPAMRVPAPVMQMAGVADAAILLQGGSLRTWSYRTWRSRRCVNNGFLPPLS